MKNSCHCKLKTCQRLNSHKFPPVSNRLRPTQPINNLLPTLLPHMDIASRRADYLINDTSQNDPSPIAPLSLQYLKGICS